MGASTRCTLNAGGQQLGVTVTVDEMNVSGVHFNAVVDQPATPPPTLAAAPADGQPPVDLLSHIPAPPPEVPIT